MILVLDQKTSEQGKGGSTIRDTSGTRASGVYSPVVPAVQMASAGLAPTFLVGPRAAMAQGALCRPLAFSYSLAPLSDWGFISRRWELPLQATLPPNPIS